MIITKFNSNVMDSGVVIGLFLEDSKVSNYDNLDKINKKENNIIEKAIENSKFTGKKNEILEISTATNYKKIILVGVGKEDETHETKKELVFSNIGGLLYPLVEKYDSVNIVVFGSCLHKPAYVALGLNLRSYNCLEYKTELKEDDKPKLKEIIITAEKAEKSKEFFETHHKSLIDGVFLARKVVSYPANDMNPEAMVSEFKKLEKNGAKVHVFDSKKLKEMGANLILAVGAGSVLPPYMVIVEYNGSGSNESPIALVGKGITFDTGGYAIKPAKGMEAMKYDMGGSGAVLGIMKSLIEGKAKANVIGAVALAENMISGTAVKPGDIIKSLSGLTVEVINPDAEGRLVLADVLYYVSTNYKPKYMIDLATLTGACVVALGNERAAICSNDKELVDALFESGATVGEKLWEMPMDDEYLKLMISEIADLKNVSDSGGGGVMSAAKFLEKFVVNTKWAHLDIAGMAWNNSNKPVGAKGASGFGVRLLNDFIEKNK